MPPLLDTLVASSPVFHTDQARDRIGLCKYYKSVLSLFPIVCTGKRSRGEYAVFVALEEEHC